MNENPLKFEKLNDYLHIDPWKCSWINGLGHVIKLRASAIPRLTKYLNSQVDICSKFQTQADMIQLLRSICSLHSRFGVTLGRQESNQLHTMSDVEQKQWADLQHRFVDTSCQQKHVPLNVFSNLRPHAGVRFLWHVMLTLCSFRNELDLLMSPTFWNAFKKAGLVEGVPNQNSV